MTRIFKRSKNCLKNLLGRFPYIYYACAAAKSWYVVRRNRVLLQRYGSKVLSLVHKELSGVVPYYAAYGTLLGIVRENGFLHHDDDIDFCVLPCDVSIRKWLELLLESGFEFLGGYSYDGKIRQIALTYKKLRVDFFLGERDENGNLRYFEFWHQKSVTYSRKDALTCYANQSIEIPNLMSFRLNGTATQIPKNYLEVLVAEYGKSWRTPDYSWNPTSPSNGKLFHSVALPGEGYCMVPLSEIS